MLQRTWCGAVVGVGLGVVAALLPAPAAAQFARYIDAYNTLARAVNERSAASGVDANFPLRYVGKGESFNTLDFETLRYRVLKMLQQGFVLGPTHFNLDVADPATAFPLALRRDGSGNAIGRHLMEDVGDGKGRFTRVPGRFVSTGNPVYSTTSWEHPVMWLHFEELKTVLDRMRYTLVQDGAYTGWRNPDNEPNQLVGWANGATWDEACNGAWASYRSEAPQPGTGGPETCMYGYGPRTGFSYYADIHNRSARYLIADLYTGVPRRVTLYLRGATPPRTDGYTYASVVYEDCESGVLQDRWIEGLKIPWSQLDPLLSGTFGAPSMKGSCVEPPANQVTARGYTVDQVRGCVEWEFPPITLTPPAEPEDTDDDGLTVSGCECTGCPAEADPAWRNLCMDTRVRFPLGITSGLQSGGLRLKAYLSECLVNGTTQQMYSLDTKVLWAVSDAATADRWEFVALRRPSGAELLFGLNGRDGGAPVDSRRKYRLRRDSGYVILAFPSPDGHRLSEHKYYQGWLAYVTMRVGTTEIIADGSWGAWRWPGLAAAFDGTHVARVDSVALLATTTYTNNLIRAVDLFHKPAGPTRTIYGYQGSRGFRTVEAGRTVDDVRVVEYPDAGAVEIWRGITDGAETRVALKSRRTGWTNEIPGLRTLAETTIVNDGQPDADTNSTFSTIAAFPWGEEEVSRTVACGLPEEQTTRFTYGTNALQPATYGRLSLQEDPDGYWTAYEYDDSGRVRCVRTPWRSSLPDETNACRVREYYYAGDPVLAASRFPGETPMVLDDRPRLTVERVGEHELSRRYASYTQACEIVKECLAAGAAYDDPDNRTTVTRFLTAWPFAGRPGSVEHPDGTRSVYAYSTPAGGLSITEDRGEGAAAITNGTRFIKVLDAMERVVSETRIDIASGLTFGSTVYTHDGFGRVVCASNTLTGEATLSTYGCCGPEQVRDGEGIVTDTVYDALKRPYAVERLGVTTFQSYDINGQVTETRQTVAGASDIVTRVEHDKAGRVRRSVDERGFVTTRQVDVTAAGERVVTTCGPDGATVVETCYRDGRLKTLTGDGVAPMGYDYGADENGTFTVEYRGADTNAADWTRTSIDRLGRTREVTQADGYTRTMTYDAFGRLVSESDGRSLALYAQNAAGRVSRQTIDMDGNGVPDAGAADRVSETETGYTLQEGRPISRTVTRVWDTVGSAAARTAAQSLASLDGRTTWSIAYDRTTRVDVVRSPATAERRETVTGADGVRTVTLYTNGQAVLAWRETAQGARIATRRQSYDAFGRLVEAEDTGPGGGPRLLRYRYDAAGNVTNASVAAAGRVLATAHEYDAAGRRTRTVLADGGMVTHEYAPGGLVIGQFGAGSYPVRYGYDDRNRLAWQATYRDGTNGTPDLTRWTYDARRGWPTARIFADGATHAFEYNPDGSLRRRVSARGVSADYAYDPAGLLTNTVYSDGTPAVMIRRDRLGRAVSVSDGTGTHAHEYRPDGLATGETFALTGLKVSWVYDAIGRRTNLSVSAGPAGGAAVAVGYGYDTTGRLARVERGVFSAGYRYAEDGTTVGGVTLGTPAGTVLAGTRAYDGFGRATNVGWTAGGTTVAGFGYGYDDAGRRTNCVLADGRRWAYEYDDGGQLVAARLTTGENTLVAGGQFEYGYDAIGNRIQMQDNGTRTTYAANALNQYTWCDQWGTGVVERICGTIFTFGGGGLGPGEAGPAAAPAPSVQARTVLVYDADGNLVRAEELVGGVTNASCRYAWDAEDRLVAVTNDQYRVSFTYDFMGRRARKVVSTRVNSAWSAVQTNLYLYDGWNPIAELITRNEEPGTTNHYLWGLDLSGTLQGAGGVGGLLGILTSDSCLLTPCFDANGNIVRLVDTNGAVAACYEYGPFGELTGTSGPAAAENPWRFSTRYTDPETRLVMYPRRPYSPTLGRWLSRDPIEEDGGLNLYGFVGNEAVDFVDPDGQAKGPPYGRRNKRFRQRDSIGFVTELRTLVGALGSVIDLDAFRTKGRLSMKPDGKHCQFLLTINGIWNKQEDSESMLRDWRADFGELGNLPNFGYIYNPTTYLTDFLQIGFLELGAIGTPSRTTAQYVSKAYYQAKKDCCKCIDIYVIAHSQGAAVLNQALPLLAPEVKMTMRILTVGAEQYIRGTSPEFGFVANVKVLPGIACDLSLNNHGV